MLYIDQFIFRKIRAKAKSCDGFLFVFVFVVGLERVRSLEQLVATHMHTLYIFENESQFLFCSLGEGIMPRGHYCSCRNSILHSIVCARVAEAKAAFHLIFMN